MFINNQILMSAIVVPLFSKFINGSHFLFLSFNSTPYNVCLTYYSTIHEMLPFY